MSAASPLHERPFEFEVNKVIQTSTSQVLVPLGSAPVNDVVMPNKEKEVAPQPSSAGLMVFIWRPRTTGWRHGLCWPMLLDGDMGCVGLDMVCIWVNKEATCLMPRNADHVIPNTAHV